MTSRSDILAIRIVFLLQPVVLGAWFPRIPQVKAAAELGEAALALALLGMPLGLLTTLFVGGRIAERLGTRGLLSVGLGAFLLVMPLPGFATSGTGLFAALVIAGIAAALAQLGLNVTASEVEKRAGRSIMNGVHGFWSLGVLGGSAIGAVQAELGWPVGVSLLGLAVLTAGPLLVAARRITDFAVPAAADGAPRKRLSKALAAVAIFAFGIAMTEGAMADWAAVYLTQTFAASPGVAGASYTVFALFLAAGRFLGDGLKTRFDVGLLARAFAACAVAGLTVALISPGVAGAYAGLAMLGFGLSLGFPLAVSAASALPGRSAAANVAVLTQMTLCGFLIGPPMIGFLAEATTMRVGLAALLPALMLSLVLAGSLRPGKG